ncbi:MAG TPA: hypothetical protein VIQ24_24335 [Pyrinomonadaceae bacterium]
MGFPAYQPRERRTTMRVSEYPRYAGLGGVPPGSTTAPLPLPDEIKQDAPSPPVEQPAAPPATRRRYAFPPYQPPTPEDIAAGSQAAPVGYDPIRYDETTGLPINNQTRARR